MKKTTGATRRSGTVNPARLAHLERQPAAALPTTGLWNFGQVCSYFSVSERMGHMMRAAGTLPAPIVLGPRVLRWVPAEVMAAAAQGMPRAQQPQREPAQLAAARQQRTTVSA